VHLLGHVNRERETEDAAFKEPSGFQDPPVEETSP